SRAAPYSNNDIFRGVTTQTGTDSALSVNGLTRQDFTIRLGQAAATEGMAFYNTVVPLSDNSEFYSFGGLSHRNGVAAGFYRLPSQEARVVPQLYPFGFLPEIRTNLDDASASAGVRGGLNGWDVDFSVTHGTNALDRSRNSVSVYAGLESQVSERFLVDVGGRLESYSDFGRTFNWKVASRFEVAPRVAVRGAASTGFRAPSLAQAWFNSVSNQFIIGAGGELILNRVLTSNNESGVTRAFGVPALREETSRNYSIG